MLKPLHIIPVISLLVGGLFLYGYMCEDMNPEIFAYHFAGQVVGVQVGVDSNPFNTLAQQLREKENALREKERQLNERDSGFSHQDTELRRIITYGSLSVGTLFVLVLFNFYLDYRRRKEK